MLASIPFRLLIIFFLVSLTGCTTPSFYFQAINGQHELLHRAEPVDVVINRSTTPPPVKHNLVRLKEIRQFAISELALPDNDSYKTYTDLKRPFVTWNVFAAKELSAVPKTWCFFVVGCVGYRGYFSKTSAEAYADKLKHQGYDVYVGGVPAYSTLGHFNDPILSTFIRYPEPELAGLIFHELAHQILYIKNDSTFNESFAATVEQEGVKRWITKHGKPEDLDSFWLRKKRQKDYINLILTYKDKLTAAYALENSIEEKRQLKAKLFEEIKQDYQQLKIQWNGYSGYDYIFAQPLNNAFIISTSMYTQLVPAFQKLLEKYHNDFKSFYAAVKALSKKPKEERERILQELSDNP